MTGSSNIFKLSISILLVATLFGCGSSGPDSGSSSGSGSSELSGVSIDFVSWIGETDTEVEFLSETEGMGFYRSSESGCDIDNYEACADGEVDTLAGSVIIDTAAQLSRNGYYQLAYNNTTSNEVMLSATKFSAREAHQSVVFNNKLW
ncbi:MAG: hypothetical protein HRU20_30765, partial [Pseudomonadales bacterium]|nr:hypothetical protein [Pseudomonadales bacterium]